MKNKIITFSVLAALLVSCEPDSLKKPNGSFTVSRNNGPIPLEVSFRVKSTDADNVKWDFGDGTFSKEFYPTHVYTDTGEFMVICTVYYGESQENGEMASTIITATAPSGEISMTPPSGMAPCRVEFDMDAGWATTYSWDFGNGQMSTEKTPSFVFRESGNYKIVCNAEGTIGDLTWTVSDTQQLAIQNEPTGLEILSAQLTKFPLNKNNGDAWDTDGAPDVFIRFVDAMTGEILIDSDIAYEISTNILPEVFNTFAYTIDDLDKKFAIEVMDSDNTNDEWMGGFYLIGSEWKSKDGEPYTRRLTFNSNDGLLQVTTDVKWLP